jgi:hypothetical protein
MRLFLKLFFAFSVTVGSLLTGPSVGAGDNMLMVVEAFARATGRPSKKWRGIFDRDEPWQRR